MNMQVHTIIYLYTYTSPHICWPSSSWDAGGRNLSFKRNSRKKMNIALKSMDVSAMMYLTVQQII